MKFQALTCLCLVSYASKSYGYALPAPLVAPLAINPLQGPQADNSSCVYGPNNRQCWASGYSVDADFDQNYPITNGTVVYNLTITNSTCNPDGNGPRPCMLINNQYPGPTIRASWGDRLIINVHNQLQNNGTSIHWHGVRQLNSTESDGVGGITECPIAPGDSKTYSFRVTQFGTSWYHSHFSSQYGDGVIGPMIFEGPASANYDEDLGPYMLNEWYYQTASQINSIAMKLLQTNPPSLPPPADNILINGTNINHNGAGNYGRVSMQAGKRYRLRLINSAVDNHYHVSLDNHNMTIIASDFIPINPITVTTLLIAIGQRYDVVIHANQRPGNYWFRASVAQECGFDNKQLEGRSIFTYNNITFAEPNTTAYTWPRTCDESMRLEPTWYQPVPSDSFIQTIQQMDVNLTSVNPPFNGDMVNAWTLGGSPLNIEWDRPTLQYILDNNSSYPPRYNVHTTRSRNAWNYWIIQQGPGAPPAAHPIHLHGHDFFVLGRQDNSTFDRTSSVSLLNFNTPPRRDTATVPSRGWMVIAFPTNNPGAWLMHCHIAWHVAGGLGSQFIELPGEITVNRDAFDQTCKNWKEYVAKDAVQKEDSGL